MVKNGKSDKTRSNRKQIMPREIKTMLRTPAVLNAKEAKKFREVLKEVAEFVKPQDPFARYDVEDFAYDRVEGERYRGLKTALIARSKSQRLKRAVTESKAKYDRRMQDACDAAETKLLTDLSKREPLPDKAELERLEAESNAELAKFRAKLQSEFEEEKKRLEQEINSLDDAMFLEEWIALCEQVDRLQSTTEKRTENTRSRLERWALGDPLRNRAEIIDGTAIEEPLVAQQPLIVPAATRPDLPAPTTTGSQLESVAAVRTAEELEAVRPQVVIEPLATEFDRLEPTGSQVEALVAELPAAKPDMLQPTAELAAEELEVVRSQVVIKPLATELARLEPTGSQVEAPVAELPAAKPDMPEPAAKLAAEEAVRQLVAVEPPVTKSDMPDHAAAGSHLEMARAERPATEPALAPRQEIDCTPVGADLIDRAAADAKVEALAAQATPKEVAVTQRQNMEPRTIEPALQPLVENPTAAARPDRMPAVSNATTRPTKTSSPAIPSGPAPAWAGMAAALGIDPQQAVAIEFASAKKTGTTTASSAPLGIPRELHGIYRQLNPQPADDTWSPRSARPRR
jgi:hypothetical protein